MVPLCNHIRIKCISNNEGKAILLVMGCGYFCIDPKSYQDLAGLSW